MKGFEGRPEVILCVDRHTGFILGVEAVPEDAPPERCVQVFLEAARSLGALPGTVAVSRGELVAVLQAALRSMGLQAVEVRQEPSLPACEAALQSMAEAMGLDLQWADRYWAQLAEAYPDVPGLMRDSAAYYRAAPWRLLDSSQVLVARLQPEGGRGSGVVRYLSVLGAAGDTFGLVVVHTLTGVEALLSGKVSAARRVASTAVTFDELDDAGPALRARLCRRYEVAGPAAFPFFMRTPTTRPERLPSPKELDELRASLQAVTTWAQATRARGGTARRASAPFPFGVAVMVGPVRWAVELRPAGA